MSRTVADSSYDSSRRALAFICFFHLFSFTFGRRHTHTVRADAFGYSTVNSKKAEEASGCTSDTPSYVSAI